MKLIDILQNRTVSELKGQCASYRLTRYSKLKKTELAQLLSETMLSDDFLERFFLSIDETAFRSFEKLIKKKNASAYELLPFAEIGFAFMDKSGQIGLVEEMQSFSFKRFDGAFYKHRKQIQKYQRYFSAFANLYGFLPFSVMKQLLTEYEGAQYDTAELEDAIQILKNSAHHYRIGENGLAAEELALDEKMYTEILLAQKGKPYARLPKVELLPYADEAYFEKTPQYDAIIRFLSTVFRLTKKKSTEMARDIAELCRAEASFSAILSYMKQMECGFTPFDEGAMMQFMSLYTDLYNHTRLWANCGHTPHSLARLAAENNR